MEEWLTSIDDRLNEGAVGAVDIAADAAVVLPVEESEVLAALRTLVHPAVGHLKNI